MMETIPVAETELALYFGCRRGLGHFLHSPSATLHWPERIPGFPWKVSHLDSGLLKNGNRRDVYDGKVFWTCGGTPLWLAFYWWDNSVDRRGASNSGFYVRGFDVARIDAAFAYACTQYSDVVARQRQPLVLQK